MRRGIVSAGNWLVDTIKFIKTYPTAGNLVTIEKVESGFGGCAHNVLADLAHLESGIPLYAGGCVGRDAWGDEIMAAIERMGIEKVMDRRSSWLPICANVDMYSPKYKYEKE